MQQSSHELEELLRREIAAAGPISFARFMEIALYHPVLGYYQAPTKQIGCQGDFYTSVSVGSLFGQLLAFQVAEWLQELLSSPPGGAESCTPLRVVEAGAHDGQLANDILSWLRRERPHLLDQIEYWIIEPSVLRSQRQAGTLQSWGARVRWCAAWENFPPTGVRGAILSNELLDAFPVFRLGWDAGSQGWFEWRVKWSEEKFGWCRSPLGKVTELDRELRTGFWQQLPLHLRTLLPDGFTIELCPGARAWWANAAGNLQRGKLLTLDYGFEAHEFLVPHRSQGTLRSYRSHRLSSNPLSQPGRQDLTAHVNFTALIETGEGAGLKTEFLGPQASFLLTYRPPDSERPAQVRSVVDGAEPPIADTHPSQPARAALLSPAAVPLLERSQGLALSPSGEFCPTQNPQQSAIARCYRNANGKQRSVLRAVLQQSRQGQILGR